MAVERRAEARGRESDKGDGGVLAWLAALVILLPFPHPPMVSHPHGKRSTASAAHVRSVRRENGSGTRSAVGTVRRVFGPRWRIAWCISFYESRHYLHARNGVNLGPWQISTTAHPWVNPWLLTHSWRYSARAAWRISEGGRSWGAWTTHNLCGA